MAYYIENFNAEKFQFHSPSAYSFFEIACIEESNLELMVEEGPLCVYKTQISPKELQEHAKTSLFMDNEKDKKYYNQSQHMEKPEI